MNNCFVCGTSAKPRRIRSMSHISGDPSSPKDCVAICDDCENDWSFALLSIVRANIAIATNTPPPNTNRNGNTPHF